MTLNTVNSPQTGTAPKVTVTDTGGNEAEKKDKKDKTEKKDKK